MLNVKFIFLTYSYDLFFLDQPVQKARGLKYILLIHTFPASFMFILCLYIARLKHNGLGISISSSTMIDIYKFTSTQSIPEICI